MTTRKQMGLCRLSALILGMALAAGCSDHRTPEELTLALAKAAAKGSATEAKDLIRKGADVNGEGLGDRPLRLAAVGGHVECVKVLLEAGADPSRTVRNNNGVVARPLVSVQATRELLRIAKNSQPKDLAALEQQYPIVKDILARGATLGDYDEIIRLLERAEKAKSK